MERKLIKEFKVLPKIDSQYGISPEELLKQSVYLVRSAIRQSFSLSDEEKLSCANMAAAKVWRKMEQGEITNRFNYSEFGPYLYTVCLNEVRRIFVNRNHAKNAISDKAAEITDYEQDFVIDIDVDSIFNADNTSDLQQKLMYAAIERLPRRQKRIIEEYLKCGNRGVIADKFGNEPLLLIKIVEQLKYIVKTNPEAKTIKIANHSTQKQLKTNKTNRIILLKNEGLTPKQIAEKLNVNIQQVYYYLNPEYIQRNRQNSRNPKPSKEKISLPPIDEKARELFNDETTLKEKCIKLVQVGYTFTSIGKFLGVNRGTVKFHAVPDYKIKQRKRQSGRNRKKHIESHSNPKPKKDPYNFTPNTPLKKKIKTLHKLKLSQNAIAKALNCSKSTVSYHLHLSVRKAARTQCKKYKAKIKAENNQAAETFCKLAYVPASPVLQPNRNTQDLPDNAERPE